jgi:hypothetical protein
MDEFHTFSLARETPTSKAELEHTNEPLSYPHDDDDDHDHDHVHEIDHVHTAHPSHTVSHDDPSPPAA